MSIETLARSYNEFQHHFGQSSNIDHTHIIDTFFTSKFKKIANGVELVSQKADLLNQLNSVKEFAGNWKIIETAVIPSADNKQCTLRYILQSEKAGDFDVIAIMTSEDSKKIDSIDEIYYQQ